MFACLHAPGNLPLLLECARQFSPLVEETSGDTVVLDIDGLESLWGTPEEIAQALLQRNGVGASVAVASNPDAAIHVARGMAGVTVIPAGREAKVLSALPLNLLGGSASPETAETLDLWGIRTFGELAALPPLGVAARLGDEGVHLQRLARGEAERLLRVPGEDLRFEWIDFLAGISFGAKKRGERLHARGAQCVAQARMPGRFQRQRHIDHGRRSYAVSV